ncbi:MAG: tRNA uridine-5-carboxymethylaminomethyl(34) synthesis GTPase MnmE, partial [candidate division WOR-3 bacterium]
MSAIGVIRVSGPDAIELITRLFTGKSSLQTVASHSVHYGTIFDPKTREPIDDVMVTVFKEPKSYTGEDLVEISCHGNPLLIDEIIGLIIEQGGRLAQAGEFTRRALLNGKFDLIQAEAILDLTTAQSQWARRNAYYQLAGGLSEKIKKIADQLEQVLIQVEANLDFPEDEEWQGLEGIKDQISRIKN